MKQHEWRSRWYSGVLVLAGMVFVVRALTSFSPTPEKGWVHLQKPAVATEFAVYVTDNAHRHAKIVL